MANIVCRVTCKFPYLGGLPRDCSENVTWWSVPSDATTAADAAGMLTDHVTNFYTQAHTGGSSVSNYMASYINRSAATIEFQMVTIATGIAVGDPITVPLIGMSNLPSGNSLPAEVALCISFGGSESGVPIASRRGRIYIGPLNVAAVASATGYARPAQVFRDALTNAAQDHWDSPGAGWDMVVYSRKLRLITLIAGGWVDNEWDTQRRRGEAATARQNWAMLGPD